MAKKKIKGWAVYVHGHDIKLNGISLVKEETIKHQIENWTKENSKIVPVEIKILPTKK